MEDATGFNQIIERTSREERLEWGTYFTGRIKDKTLVIDMIADSKKAETSGFILKRSATSIQRGRRPDEAQGKPGGTLHYHPPSLFYNGADNFSINLADRAAVQFNVHLLSFNVRGHGPIIVGYNSFFDFIPTRTDPHVLVRASFKETLSYLDALRTY